MSFVYVPLAVLVLASPATAARLAYDAPAGCPDRPRFIEAVTERGGHFTDSGEPGPARLLMVSIHKRSDGFDGAFQVSLPSGTTAKRQVRGQSCGEVVEALAVVTAIELQASAPEAVTPSTPVAPVPAPAPPQPDAAAASPPAAAADTGLRGHTQVFPSRAETVRVGPGDLRFDLERDVSVTFGGSRGLVPSTTLPRLAITFTGANFVTTPEGDQRIAGLVYQVHVDMLSSATHRSADTATDVYGVSFAISTCQSPTYDSRGLSLLFCLEYGGGYLNLATKTLDGLAIATKNVGFGTVGALTDLQYNLTRHVLVSLRVGGSYEFGDISAERADGSRIFKSSPWSAYALAGVGFRF